jgi:N-methylhydantoinase A/oxoprolinase/acetone carboxylase beta subunit
LLSFAHSQVPLAHGVTSIAVLCLHSYVFDEHEKKLGAICKGLGYKYIALSSAYAPRDDSFLSFVLFSLE